MMMPFDRKTLVIPDGTKFEENFIYTNGDAIIGNGCEVLFGIKTNGRFFAGERVKIRGNINAGKDVRIDLFSSIGGNVRCGKDVYIGEGTKIKGKLSLKGDLDVGENVEIKEGFEAKGWINIRSPIPFIIYLFIYLAELLKRGHSEEVDRILNELEEDNPIPISEVFFFIPNGSVIAQESVINGNIRVGKNCTILGNYLVKGNAFIGESSTIYGAIRANGKIIIEKGAIIEGNIECDDEIKLGKCRIGGDIRGKRIEIFRGAIINGTVNATEGIKFITKKSKEMEEKVKRFEDNVDIVDEIADMLE